MSDGAQTDSWFAPIEVGDGLSSLASESDLRKERGKVRLWSPKASRSMTFSVSIAVPNNGKPSPYQLERGDASIV